MELSLKSDKGRTPYLITRALKTFMWGSIMAAVSSQVATTTDAIVVSNLIGPDAMSAINLVLPILTIFSSLMILFGVGASVVAAKAIGRRDDDTANGIFTTCVISSAVVGGVLAVAIYVASPWIISLLSGSNHRIYEYALQYLQIMCISVPFMMMAGVLENFVKTDGNPRMVMYAVLAGSLLNLALDIIFISVFKMGIAGSAWATGANYLLALLLCLIHFKSPHHSLKWRLDVHNFRVYFHETVVQGFSMAVNTLLLAASIYAINSIVLHSQGADGLYCWSVCVQVFMIMQMVLTGIGSSIYAIGGILVGEQDMSGLTILNRKCMIYICCSLAVLTAVILSAPGFFGSLFGGSKDNASPFLPEALRIFSLILIPYSIVVVLRATYQILGRNMLSLILSVAQLVLMVAFVWSFSYISSVALWWGFPVSAFILTLGLILYTVFLHEKNPDLNVGTLIPKHEKDPALNISVRMDEEDVIEAEHKISSFLNEQGIDGLTTYEVRLSCEELMNNIVRHTKEKQPEKHYFDLHIRSNDKEVNVLLKDDGRPFNPILKEKIQMTPDLNYDKLGLKVVNSVSSTINYKYMYDQNMVLLTFLRP